MSDAGSVITVTGRMPPEELGTTLPHEHTFINLAEAWYTSPDSARKQEIAEQPISLDNLWYVHRNPSQHRDNMVLSSMADAIHEISRFRRKGGDTIVDVTPKNIGGDPARVVEVARETGVNFVHGTAIYTIDVHPDRIPEMDIEELSAEFVSDVRDGIDETDVRAGIVGEIGLSGRIHDQEEKVLRAAARAAKQTGAPLAVHPPGRTPHSQKDRTWPSSRWGLRILDMIEEEGLSPGRVAICHMDWSQYEDLSYQKELADRGAYIEYDLWGYEIYLETFRDGCLSDSQRIDAIEQLIESGHEHKILLSHDICQKLALSRYGGFGYSHLIDNGVQMMRDRGLTDDKLDTLVKENPREFLTFVEPE